MEALLVITNLPDRDAALALAALAVERGVAACVNVLDGCTSVYRWQGAIETASEVPVLFKTTVAAYPALEALVRERHPYELPELIAVRIEGGLPAYLEWIAGETKVRS